MPQKDNLQIMLEDAVFRNEPWDAVGCTCEQLRDRVQAQFQGTMSWLNDDLWHLGFAVPRCAFKEKDSIRAFHYSNIKPKWGRFGAT